MKIDGNNPYINSEVHLRPRDVSTTPASGRPVGPQVDRIELSVTAKELQALYRENGESEEIRSERVEEIRSQVEAGTYDIRAEEIAEAIITGHLIDKSA
ncbi:MAG: flagellar biosynthesis anti-sigma factor FlgM [Acidobacteriota bacterium]